MFGRKRRRAADDGDDRAATTGFDADVDAGGSEGVRIVGPAPKAATPTTPTEDAVAVAGGADVAEAAGIPSGGLGSGRPDEAVLDELSKAFGRTGESDRRAANRIGSDDDEPSDQPDTAPHDQPDTQPDAQPDTQPDTQPLAAPDIDDDTGDHTDTGADTGTGTGPNDLAGSITGSPESPGAGPATGPVVISIGGDDDLPDAVYLDDELALDDESGSTVFIDDDGTGDAIAPKDATAPGIEPRLRQRRIGVRRAASRKRLKWVVLGVVVALVLLAGLSLLGSSLFAVDDVEVSGNQYADPAVLERVVADLLDTPVLLVDTSAAEAELEAIPWVDDARVRTKFPDRATIEIRERTPVATMRGADGLFRVIDATGRVLDVIEGQPVAFVLISGQGTLDANAGAFAPVGPSAAASLVTKLTPTVRPLVESIEVTPGGTDLVLNLAPPPDGGSSGVQTSPFTVRFGSAIGDSEQIDKLVRLEKKLGDLPDRPVSEINVATNEVTVL